jgi:NAD(P)H dehydrogenase (quinone)
MKIAVTGSTGHLGALVVEKLLERVQPGDVVALARNPEKAASLKEKGVNIGIASYTDPESLKKAMAGVDRLLLVSSSEVGQRAAQHKNVIDAAKAAGVKHIVYTSITHADTSANALAPEHKETEEYIVKSGMTYTILRNNWYIENYITYVDTAKNFGQIAGAAGAGKVGGASREDYAEGAAVVLSTDGHENKIYEFTGDKAFDYNDLAKAIGEIIGKEVPYAEISVDAMTKMLTEVGMDEGTAGFYALLDKNIEEGTLDVVSPDLEKLIGRKTRTLKEVLGKAA